MSRHRRLPVLFMGAALLIPGLSASAQEVVLFQEVPTAEELNAVLFGEPTQKAPAIKTRSIRFHTEASPPAPAAEPEPAVEQQVAAAPAAAQQPEPQVALGFNINFKLNSTEMLPESRPYIDRLGEVLSMPENQGKALIVVGHADASGDERHNMALSQARAEAVRAYLADTWQVAPDKLAVRGLGESRPLPGTDPYDGINRRVEFYTAN